MILMFDLHRNQTLTIQRAFFAAIKPGAIADSYGANNSEIV